jgi:hypothetical protein
MCDSQDVILGKIYFLLVRIKIKFMELAVIRREAAGALVTGFYVFSVTLLSVFCVQCADSLRCTWRFINVDCS